MGIRISINVKNQAIDRAKILNKKNKYQRIHIKFTIKKGFRAVENIGNKIRRLIR